MVTTPLKLVIFGLSISSSWGNGHATLWRGLCRALARRGHITVFFEKDVPYYSSNRDMTEIAGCQLRLYRDWADVAGEARRELADCDVGMVTSYCPDGREAGRTLLESRAPVRSFYDLDTPITLSQLQAGEPVPYLPNEGLAPFDIVLSFTGGSALELLSRLLGARKVAPLYGSVDPATHRPAEAIPEFAGDISYLGTYAADRQETLDRLFMEPSRIATGRRFVIGGAQYPDDFPSADNMFFVRHLPPSQHPAFYCSSRMTLNVTRRAMAEMGYCPSGRLFEAAGCGAPLLSDEWEGIDKFYRPEQEILLCRSTEDVLRTLERSDAELKRIARAARERTLAEHTAEHRVIELERILEDSHVGHNSSGGEGQSHPASRVFEGTSASRQPA